MSAIPSLHPPTATRTEPANRSALQRTWLDSTIALLSCWFVGGIFLDGWAHRHVAGMETFFTPWHAVLYSGYTATAAFLLFALARGRRTSASWRTAIPAGYELSLLGAALFAIGGVLDLTWHLIFGIERSVDALLSPTHLLLALGMILLVTGPFRAAWHRVGASTRRERVPIPALISLLLLLSVLTFFTQYANAFGEPFAAQSFSIEALSNPDLYQALGISSILLQSAILVGLLLLTVRRWWLPPGTLTFLIGVNVALMVLESSAADGLQPGLIAAGFASGVVADCLLSMLRPNTGRVPTFRLFASLVPATMYAIYFLVLQLSGGIWWSVHFWTGSIVLAGVTGWMLSYVLLPPAVPERE